MSHCVCDSLLLAPSTEYHLVQNVSDVDFERCSPRLSALCKSDADRVDTSALLIPTGGTLGMSVERTFRNSASVVTEAD